MESSSEILFKLWIFLLGGSIGSFLNVIIFRLPRGFSISLPSRSACAKCKKKLPWFVNIPFLGFLLSMGKCSKCKNKISLRYLVVEILTAILFLAIYNIFGGISDIGFVIYYCLFASLLIAATFIDLDFFIIPDEINFTGMVIGLLGAIFIRELSFINALLGLIFGSGLFWLMATVYQKMTGRDGLGFGDVKLLGMIGSFLCGLFGLKAIILVVFSSSFIGSVLGITVMLINRKSLKLAIPFGPFLSIGALVTLFWGDYLVFRLFP